MYVMLQGSITHCSGRIVPLHPMGILIHSPQSLRVHIDKLMSVWVNEFIQRWRSIYALLLCDAALLGVIILYWIFFTFISLQMYPSPSVDSMGLTEMWRFSTEPSFLTRPTSPISRLYRLGLTPVTSDTCRAASSSARVKGQPPSVC